MNKLILTLIVIMSSCGTKPFYYSKYNLTHEEVIKSYANVSVIQNEIANKLVCTSIECFDTELDTVSNTNFTGTFYAQVLIDQNGEAESIYFNNSVNPKLDSIAIILLKNNIFLPLNKVTQYNEKYSILFGINVSKGTIVGNPFVIYNKETRQKLLEQQVINGFEKPIAISKIIPEYPKVALDNDIQGIVEIQIKIDKEGDVAEAYVVYSDNTILENAALEAAKQYKFTPAKKNGEVIESWFIIPFTFKIKEPINTDTIY